MAEPRNRDSDGSAPEKEGLSARMRELIEIATVEERRRTDVTDSGRADERRRRTDHPDNVRPQK